jgi:hypothetical protein
LLCFDSSWALSGLNGLKLINQLYRLIVDPDYTEMDLLARITSKVIRAIRDVHIAKEINSPNQHGFTLSTPKR